MGSRGIRDREGWSRNLPQTGSSRRLEELMGESNVFVETRLTIC
jgi:hypothetical protein